MQQIRLRPIKYQNDRLTFFSNKYNNCKPFIESITHIGNSLTNIKRSREEIRLLDSKIVNKKGDIVAIRLRNKPFEKSLSPFMTNIKLLPLWSVDKYRNLCDFWKACHQNNSLQNKVFNDPFFLETEWCYNGDLSTTFSEKPQFSFMRPFFQKWLTSNDYCINLNPFLKVFRDMGNHNIKDYNAIDKIISEERNNMAETLISTEAYIINEIDNLDAKIQLHDKLTKVDIDKALVSLFPENDFYSVLPFDKPSAWWLSEMDRNLKRLPGGLDWLINDFQTKTGYHNDFIYKEICREDRCGHTGATAHWTLMSLKTIYSKGWSQWVKSVLKLEKII